VIPIPPWLPLVLATLLAPAVGAETRYVTDQYDFNLRSGESTRYKILRTLPSGTPLEVLGVNTDSGYAKVRTSDGLTGYMLVRYLQEEPGARGQLEAMQQRLTELQQTPDKLAARLGELQREHEALKQKNAALISEKEQVERALAEIRHASANVMRINQERKQLQDQVATLVMQVDGLEQRNLELTNRNKQDWFLIGAGVVVAGILIGLILPNLRMKRRRSTWGSL
jgi:SH3 domain protein